MNDFIVHPAARDEFEHAAGWYSERSRTAETRFAAEINSAIDAICKSPEIWPCIDEIHRFYLLRVIPYLIVYRLTSDIVEIVAIRHTAQEPNAWVGR